MVVVRETFKYGERGFRYCCLDLGHAAAALGAAAAALGWRVAPTGATHEELSALLGVGRTEWRPLEDEEPALLLWVDGFAAASRPAQARHEKRGIPC